MTNVQIHTKSGKLYFMTIEDAKDLYAGLCEIFVVERHIPYEPQWVDTNPRTGEPIMGTECQSERE